MCFIDRRCSSLFGGEGPVAQSRFYPRQTAGRATPELKPTAAAVDGFSEFVTSEFVICGSYGRRVSYTNKNRIGVWTGRQELFSRLTCAVSPRELTARQKRFRRSRRRRGFGDYDLRPCRVRGSSRRRSEIRADRPRRGFAGHDVNYRRRTTVGGGGMVKRRRFLRTCPHGDDRRNRGGSEYESR